MTELEAMLQRHAAALGDDVAEIHAQSLRVHSQGRCVDLLNVYNHRSRMLRRFSRPHPERLRRETEALCVALARFHDDEYVMWMFEGRERDIMLVEHATARALLGIVHTIGRSQVASEEAWLALWGPEDWSKAPP